MSLTLIDVAPATTWLLVSTSPVEVSTIPVPAAVAWARPCVEITSTRPGEVRLAIAAVLSRVALPVGEPAKAQAVPPATSAPAVTPDARIRTGRRGRRGGAACWPPGAPRWPNHTGGGGGGGTAP